jgi:Ca2+:H+ antiporter
MAGLENGGANEHTPLISNSNKKPLYEHDNPLIRWPMFTLHKTWQVLASNYVNVCLVFVPAGIITGALGVNPTTVFILNFLAIIPLASLLSFATEELAAKLGQTIGGLMNATFGNAVELIVSIIALKEGQIRIVQSSMLGSILSNILLVSAERHIDEGVVSNDR